MLIKKLNLKLKFLIKKFVCINFVYVFESFFFVEDINEKVKIYQVLMVLFENVLCWCPCNKIREWNFKKKFNRNCAEKCLLKK